MKNKSIARFQKDIEKNSINSIALKIKIPYATLWRIVNGDGGCNMRTWKKIESYYK
jgi:hypothetical protein